MIKYIFKRIMLMLPTLAVVVIIGFMLNQCAPGDPVRTYLGVSEGVPSSEKEALSDEAYANTRKLLGLDLPLFYFSLSPLSQSDTLFKIQEKRERDALSQLTDQYGNWPQVQNYFIALRQLQREVNQIAFTSSEFETRLGILDAAYRLTREPQLSAAAYQFRQLDSLMSSPEPKFAQSKQRLSQVIAAKTAIESEATPWKNWVPTFHYYGIDNQFHRWLINAFTLNFGKSYINKQDVKFKLLDRLPWTILLSSLSIFLSFVISIPLGVFSAQRRNSKWDKGISLSLFFMYSLPSFWIALLLMTYFANPEHLGWFPPIGLKSITNDGSWGFWATLLDYAHHLVLPTIAYTMGSFAFLSRQMRASMIHSLDQDYIRTARAKGVSEKRIGWHHAFRNSLSPIITTMAGILPGLITGSIIIEFTFAIPGMGSLLLESITSKDFPTISAIFLLSGVLTILGILLSDILLALSDPRIKLARK